MPNLEDGTDELIESRMQFMTSHRQVVQSPGKAANEWEQRSLAFGFTLTGTQCELGDDAQKAAINTLTMASQNVGDT